MSASECSVLPIVDCKKEEMAPHPRAAVVMALCLAYLVGVACYYVLPSDMIVFDGHSKRLLWLVTVPCASLLVLKLLSTLRHSEQTADDESIVHAFGTQVVFTVGEVCIYALGVLERAVASLHELRAVERRKGADAIHHQTYFDDDQACHNQTIDCGASIDKTVNRCPTFNQAYHYQGTGNYQASRDHTAQRSKHGSINQARVDFGAYANCEEVRSPYARVDPLFVSVIHSVKRELSILIHS
ncbi:hypothetical protein Poli38472_009497 [Pythium oligandrum]|uniref:Uncharacterized protein n=1 Tax=Pythium oligandrum TaxID=41045 RepID=A0A8K1CEJ9_PYTOL|nr:hypothetical protein Poli38472_009497 [Pythium oligandrum]|eukprot:TMW62004.1 hypothetical protein Poli38472_009497 [Pythium oligandrum]